MSKRKSPFSTTFEEKPADLPEDSSTDMRMCLQSAIDQHEEFRKLHPPTVAEPAAVKFAEMALRSKNPLAYVKRAAAKGELPWSHVAHEFKIMAGIVVLDMERG